MFAVAPFRAVVLLALALLPLPVAAKVPDFEKGEIVEAVAVLEGGEVALADGRHVAPLGIVLPRGGQAETETVREAVAARLIGRALELRFDGSRGDRHGRVLAHLFIDGRWVEKDLVRRGLARVSGTADHRLGLVELLRSEAEARRARRGLWREPAYAVRRADEAGRYAGSFQLVEGEVIDAGRAEGALFLDFAPAHRGFRLRLSPEALPLFRAADIDPEAFVGARIRARGFLHGTERATIDVTYPEQIERLSSSRVACRAGAKRACS
jgi:endonuclease YncB( thermonuclease family)